MNPTSFEDVAAVGKNLLLTFEGGVVVRSHLRMRGRWQLRPRGSTYSGRPWLVLRGEELEAVLWNGPVLELGTRAIERLGPDILAEPLALDAIVKRFRSEPSERELGDALLDQRLVSGIGNVWRAEALWAARLSPFKRANKLSADELTNLHAAINGVLSDAVERSMGLPAAGLKAEKRSGMRVHATPGRTVLAKYDSPFCTCQLRSASRMAR